MTGYQEEDGWIELKKVTVFIGNQGSGKSTVAKLISTFTWIEKALVRGDYDKRWFERRNRLKNQFLSYHRLENYFHHTEGQPDTTVIEYVGDAFHIIYENGSLTFREVSHSSYQLPQIMYVPAERNFIANVKTPKALKLTSDALIEFVTEFDNAKQEIKSKIQIPVNQAFVEYQKLNDVVYISGSNYKIKLSEASSGFQSLVPLFLVSWHLAHSVKKQTDSSEASMSSGEMERFRKGVSEIWDNETLTDEQRRIALSVLTSKFNKTAFVNIVEEPEQNLFPASQWEMLKRLLEFNHMSEWNRLVMTTHSPYIINYLSIAVQGGYLRSQIMGTEGGRHLLEPLAEIVPDGAALSSDDLVVYQLNETDGSIRKLPAYEGIPSDSNYLNQLLAEGNELFDRLLSLEQEV